MRADVDTSLEDESERVDPARTHAIRWCSLALGLGVLSLMLSSCGTSSSSSLDSIRPFAHPVRSIPRLEAEIRAMQTRTFEATWSATAHGSTVKVVYAQAPAHRYFRVGNTFVVMTSHRVSFCAVSAGCITRTVDPLQSLVGVYNGQEALTVLRQQLLPRNRGPMRTGVSYFGESIAGMDSTCVVVSGLGHAGRWCVATPGGIVTRWRTAQYSLTLTSFSRTPENSLFALPTA